MNALLIKRYLKGVYLNSEIFLISARCKRCVKQFLIYFFTCQNIVLVSKIPRTCVKEFLIDILLCLKFILISVKLERYVEKLLIVNIHWYGNIFLVALSFLKCLKIFENTIFDNVDLENTILSLISSLLSKMIIKNARHIKKRDKKS